MGLRKTRVAQAGAKGLVADEGGAGVRQGFGVVGIDEQARVADDLRQAGAVSDDGQPSGTLTYTWSVIQGDAGAVTISDPAALKTQATFSKPGVYILKLVASDGEASGRHFMMVKVGEQPDGMEGVTKPIFSADK